MRRQRQRGYSRITQLLSEPRRLIVTILLGNEFANLLISSIMASLVIQFYGEGKSYYNLLVATPLLLLFGEITPKAIAVRNNAAFARFQAPLIQSFAVLITPIRVVVRSVSDKLITLLVGSQRSHSNLISEDMVIALTKEAVGEGTLEQLEAHYINQVFKFGDATVNDAMVPRSNMLFVAHNAKPEEVIDTIRQHKRDKLVIYREKHDQVVGLLYARDLLSMELTRKRSANWLVQIVRKPMLVPESKSLLELFHQMRAQKVSVALVIDEYGGITGQVSLHDVLEFVFGAIPQEQPAALGLLKKTRLPGTMEVGAFNRTYHTSLETEHGDTLNGLLIHQFGELPAPKVCISVGEVNFTVLKVEGNRITQVIAESASKSGRLLRNPVKKKSIAQAATDTAAKSQLNAKTRAADKTTSQVKTPIKRPNSAKQKPIAKKAVSSSRAKSKKTAAVKPRSAQQKKTVATGNK